jgi:Cu2+-exporting ATPase
MSAPAGERIEFQRSGDARFRVRGCEDPAIARELVEWFARRPEVTCVRRRPQSETIVVDYDDVRDGGAPLLRAARDYAFSLGRTKPVRRRAPRVAIVHELPGRTRLTLVGATRADLARLALWLKDQPGVHCARPGAASIVVFTELSRHDPRALVKAIEASDPSMWPPPPPPEEKGPWLTLAFDGAALLAAHRSAIPRCVVGLAIFAGAMPTVRRTLEAARERRLSVDMLDLLAIVTSVAVGAPSTAALITLLLAVGDFVLHLTKRRAHSALASAISLDAPTAWRLRCDGLTELVSAGKLRPGDRIVCDVGARVAADGVIERGIATLDTRALTGESTPRTSTEGNRVMASSIVLEGSMVVAVQRVGRDTTAGRIRQILECAGEKPMTLQRETERVADHLVLPTLALAGGSAALTREINRMISVLITDFGTGIRISVPTSALVAMTLATREGILIKGGHFLERLARTDTVVFDKTGTLTSGSPEVVDVVSFDDCGPRRAVAFAAAIETRQNHPVAEALRALARDSAIEPLRCEVSDQTFAVGRGVVGRCGPHVVAVGGARLMAAEHIRTDGAGPTLKRHERASLSSLCIAIDGRLAAVLGYADRVRPESRAMIRRLRGNGRRRIVLMSGDASGPAEEIGRILGVDEVLSQLLPDEKAENVRRMQRAGRTVAMVGDGINDAPALALADVGISLTGATDIALDTADVVLLSGNLSRLPNAFHIADRAMRAIHVGLGIVIVPNALAILLGALGAIGPGAATVLNNGSTVAAAVAALAPVARGSRTLAIE